FDLYAIERPRVVEADNYSGEKPITVTASHSDRSAGGKHDYFSEGDYWWPDPKNPNGPYIRRDGMSNPGNFDDHRKALLRLSVQAPALSAAWVLTGQRKYAEHAADHLRAWFLDKDTLMNPNLQYAQAIHGRVTGRGTGIIDTLQLVEVFRGARAIEPSGVLSAAEQQGLRNWVGDYLRWLTTSQYGRDERDTANNHATCWALQAAEFATYTGNTGVQNEITKRFETVLLPGQMAPNGSFPRELARTKPYSYSLFNLEAMSGICQVLSTPGNNLWTFQLPDGRSIGKGVAFMYPYIADKKKWPYPPDVMYFDNWPLRQQSLLFAGLALNRPEYLALWRRLNPKPKTEEAVRNYPIRQPVLWVSRQNGRRA
ncbi:MAG TPA: alginate lyase family protein, partial [Bryobacteraceae bacterium]